MPTREAVISTITLILSLLTITTYGGAIPYDTICSNNYYTIRGNDPISSDIPHHYAWVVSSDGGASWQRIPNSNHRDLTITEPLSGMTNMQVRRLLYKRYIFSPQQTSQSEIVGLVMAKGYTLSRTIDTVTPCVDSKGFQITTPLPATFEWRCLESGKTLQPQNTSATLSKYRVRMVDLKTSDEEFPNGLYSLLVSIRFAGGYSESIHLSALVNPSTVNPLSAREVAYTFNGNDQLNLNGKWGGVDAQRWTIPSDDIGKLYVETGNGMLHGLKITFMKNVTIDAVCADYPDRHYQITFREKQRDIAYSGAMQELYIPYGTYQMQCWGAQGQDGWNKNGTGCSRGGYGAYTRGILDLWQGNTFFVCVGGKGSMFNSNVHNTSNAVGGGATDIRLNNGNGTWNEITSLRSRIMVAAGGGGGCCYVGSGGATNNANAGISAGGALAALTSSWEKDGHGATQTAGGATGNRCYPYSNRGQAGWFGVGGSLPENPNGGNGGGGWYGGGSGTAGDGRDGNGGGGSSFISGYPGCNALNAAGAHSGQPNHVSGYVFRAAAMCANTRGGHGYFRITYDSEPIGVDLKKVRNYGSYRAWSDGTFAQSALEYRYPLNSSYRYEGDTGNGIYRIDPDGPSGPLEPFDVYGDMTTDGGGWTMIVAQYEADPVPNWNEGIQSDYDPTLATQRGFALNTSQIPPHTYVAFGKDLNPTIVGYSLYQYTTGNINTTQLTNIKNNKYYHIHRNSGLFFNAHDPESTSSTWAPWVNTLTYNVLNFQATSGDQQRDSWAFSPLNDFQACRGYALNGWNPGGGTAYLWAKPGGDGYSYTLESFAWTIWVR